MSLIKRGLIYKSILVSMGLAFWLLPESIKIEFFDEIRMEANAQINDWLSEPDSFLLSGFDRLNGPQESSSITVDNDLVHETIEEWIKKSDTEVLIIQKGSVILYESYSPDSLRGRAINGMSMVKNLVAILVGIAIDEGRIVSQHDEVDLYLPELEFSGGEAISIRDLLNHTSGIEENLLSIFSTLGGSSLIAELSSINFKSEKKFSYKNTNYHLLSLILSRVYQKPFHAIVEDKLWAPMKLSEGEIIGSSGYCCLFASARTWLAIGQLYLDRGKYKGTQIVSRAWIEIMLSDSEYPDRFFVQTTGTSRANSYGYHIYRGLEDYPNYFWIEGMGLQVIMIDPMNKIVIVRLGEIPSWFRSQTNRNDKNLLEDLLNIIAVSTVL